MTSVRPLSHAGGVVIEGIDLAKPIAEEVRTELGRLFDEHGLLLFRDQQMTPTRLVDATHIFGETALHPLGNIHHPDAPEVTVISTHGRLGDVIPEDPDALVGKIDWHTDQAYVVAPNRGGLMYPVEIPPEGGKTGFVDRQRVYDALPAGTKARIDELTVIQSWRYAQESISKNPSFRTDEGAKMLELDRFPDLGFPLVLRHPRTGRKILNTPPMWSSGIVELPGVEGRALLDELIEHMLQPGFIYWHSYRLGDLAAWDNWREMHAASGTLGRYRRIMYRTVLSGGPELGWPLDPAEMAAAQARFAAATA